VDAFIRYAISINGGRIVAFGSVVPYAPDAIDELKRIKNLGLFGVTQSTEL